MHVRGNRLARARQRDDERAAILGVRLAGDESMFDEAIENARQRRSLVCQTFVQFAYGRHPGLREMREDMRLALGQAVLTKEREVQADPVGRSMNRGDEQKLHASREVLGRVNARRV